jgi:hypothetical protein
MAYMDQKKKAVIAANLNPVLKKYGMKGTLRVQSHISIHLTLTEGPLFFVPVTGINPYWYQDHYSGTEKEFLDEAFAAIMSADYYDNSDITTDYFSTAYYFSIDVGRYSKPYRRITSGAKSGVKI